MLLYKKKPETKMFRALLCIVDIKYLSFFPRADSHIFEP